MYYVHMDFMFIRNDDHVSGFFNNMLIIIIYAHMSLHIMHTRETINDKH